MSRACRQHGPPERNIALWTDFTHREVMAIATNTPQCDSTGRHLLAASPILRFAKKRKPPDRSKAPASAVPTRQMECLLCDCYRFFFCAIRPGLTALA